MAESQSLLNSGQFLLGRPAGAKGRDEFVMSQSLLNSGQFLQAEDFAIEHGDSGRNPFLIQVNSYLRESGP